MKSYYLTLFILFSFLSANKKGTEVEKLLYSKDLKVFFHRI